LVVSWITGRFSGTSKAWKSQYRSLFINRGQLKINSLMTHKLSDYFNVVIGDVLNMFGEDGPRIVI